MKLVLIFIIFLTHTALAASTCENIESDINEIGKRIESFKVNDGKPGETYLELAGKYDKALAEELLYAGLKEMLKVYEKSKVDLATSNSVSYDVKFNEIVNEGIDVRTRLVVLKEMIDFSAEVGDDENKFYDQQSSRKCDKKEGVTLSECQRRYHQYRPMIMGYFQAMKKLKAPKPGSEIEIMKMFKVELAKINDQSIKAQLAALEATQDKIKQAGLKCKSTQFKDCKEIASAVEEQAQFFKDISAKELATDLAATKERHEKLVSLHELYAKDPNKKVEEDFIIFQKRVEDIFKCPAKKIVDPNNTNSAEAMIKGFCPVANVLSDVDKFKDCLKTVDKDQLDKKIAEAKKNRVLARTQLDSLSQTVELKNLIDIQTLLYNRYKSDEAACVKIGSKPYDIQVLACGKAGLVDPVSASISFLTDSVNNIVLYLNDNKELKQTLGAQQVLQKLCDKEKLVLKSCSIQTVEQKAAQRKVEQFHDNFIVEKSRYKNGADTYIRRKSWGSYLGNAFAQSFAAPDTMPFVMNALTFNGRVDMMAQQAQGQAQYNHNMEQWNNIYMGNLYGGVNDYSNLYDPTNGSQNAANFGFNFTPS